MSLPGVDAITKIKVAPTGPDDVTDVLSNPWPITALEMRGFGKDAAAVGGLFQQLRDKGRCYTIWKDGLPVAICGAELTDALARRWRTSFIGSTDLDSCAGIVARCMRGVLFENAEREGARSIEAITVMSGPRVVKWFDTLGMSRDQDYHNGRFHRYVVHFAQ